MPPRIIIVIFLCKQFVLKTSNYQILTQWWIPLISAYYPHLNISVRNKPKVEVFAQFCVFSAQHHGIPHRKLKSGDLYPEKCGDKVYGFKPQGIIQIHDQMDACTNRYRIETIGEGDL